MAAPVEVARTCEVCGATLELLPNHACANCKSPPRVRSLVHFVADRMTDALPAGTVLAFAMDGTEERVLAQLDRPFESVSLFGSYRAQHTMGVDARDLSRYQDGEFAAVYSCLLFDYFLEHEAALREAARVLAPTGMFWTHIAGFRLREDDSAPVTLRVLEPAPGFYDYVPPETPLLSVRVGAEWFIDAMGRAGLVDCGRWHRVDEASGVPCDWFYGRRPQA